MTDRADRLDARDVTQARQLRHRAGKLFLRGRDHALHALETRHPGWAGVGSKHHAPDPTLGPPLGAIELGETSIL